MKDPQARPQSKSQLPGILAARRFTPTMPKPGDKISSAPVEKVTPTTVAPIEDSNNGLFVKTIECKKEGTKQVYLYLTGSMKDESFLSKFSRIRSAQGRLAIALPNTQAKFQTMDCFGKNDLTVNENGVLTLNGVWNAEVVALESPPRLLIALP